jgi:hypothetical protein
MWRAAPVRGKAVLSKLKVASCVGSTEVSLAAGLALGRDTGPVGSIAVWVGPGWVIARVSLGLMVDGAVCGEEVRVAVGASVVLQADASTAASKLAAPNAMLVSPRRPVFACTAPFSRASRKPRGLPSR